MLRLYIRHLLGVARPLNQVKQESSKDDKQVPQFVAGGTMGTTLKTEETRGGRRAETGGASGSTEGKKTREGRPADTSKEVASDDSSASSGKHRALGMDRKECRQQPCSEDNLLTS